MPVLGIDVGGTNIDIGLVSEEKILKEFSLPTEADKGKDVFLNNLLKAIETVRTKNTSAIGLGFPGSLDLDKGLSLKSPNLPIKNFPIRDFISDKFKLPVYLNNDANCFVLGEALFGAAKGYKNVLGLTLGTGIGGGIVINKKIFTGKSNAGEFGHITIDYNGWPCNCGSLGCFEEYASARGIMRIARKVSVISPLEVQKEAKKGNTEALRVWEDVGFYIGIGVANLVKAFDPDVIVIGGKISKAYRFFHKKMKETAKKYSFIGIPPIVKSKLGTTAAILGAAALCKQ